MIDAQNEIFSHDYYEPAAEHAASLGLTSPLAAAIFYDTAVQGGLNAIIDRTGVREVISRADEGAYLRSFLLERRSYLQNIADRKLTEGKPDQANMLNNAAGYRVGALLKLVDNGNLELRTPFVTFNHSIEAR